MLKIYKCSAFEHTHENDMANELVRLLEIQYKNSAVPVLLLINYRNMDMLLIKQDAIVIIEMKDFGGSLQAIPKEGAWAIDQIEVKGGANGKNPYQQAAANKWQLVEKLGKCPLFANTELKHINAVVVFNRPIQKAKAVKDAEREMCWFKVSDMEHVIGVINNITSSKIHFSDEDFGMMPNCLKVEEHLQSVSADPRGLEKQLREAKMQVSVLNKENTQLSGQVDSLQSLVKEQDTAKREEIQHLQNEIQRLETLLASVPAESPIQEELALEDVPSASPAPARKPRRSYGAMLAALLLLVFGLSCVFAFQRDTKVPTPTATTNVAPVKDSVEKVEPAPIPAQETIATVQKITVRNPLANSPINLRAAASVKARKVGTITKETTCTLIAKSEAMETLMIGKAPVTDYWYQIEMNDKAAWVFGYYVEE
jgi:TolA-binding protein